MKKNNRFGLMSKTCTKPHSTNPNSPYDGWEPGDVGADVMAKVGNFMAKVDQGLPVTQPELIAFILLHKFMCKKFGPLQMDEKYVEAIRKGFMKFGIHPIYVPQSNLETMV